MQTLSPLQPIDYLIIGHLTCDLTPAGSRIGGTASYAALTARAHGMRVGIVTSWAGNLPQGVLQDIPVINYPTEKSTTFENIYTPEGRIQILHHVAPQLDYFMVPEAWRDAAIIHLGPVAQEVEPSLVRRFPSALVGVTPQGWMRQWDAAGRVSPRDWLEATFVLQHSSACVISVEDVGGDEECIAAMAASSRILVVTEGNHGARLYWHGDVRRFRAPQVKEVDATGAGDIFAATFFTRLHLTQDPWESARFATQVASASIARVGLEGIPTLAEIEAAKVEVL